MKIDPFVLPFTIGFIFLILVLLVKFSYWIHKLDRYDKRKLKKGLWSKSIFVSVKEIFMESLVHRKIFKVNPLLGYMHMSLALGWFLLIITGHIESLRYAENYAALPVYSIFLKHFVHNVDPGVFSRFFNMLADGILLIILIGVTLALLKRLYSGMFGMKKTTQLKLMDKLALYSLWLIFPLRLISESLTSGIYGNGSFLTGTLGSLFSGILPAIDLAYPAWWAYSLSLGVFFVSLPYSRYMHIPAEIPLIFLRNCGIQTKNNLSGFSEFEVNACSRCGICLDKCQQLSMAQINHAQAVYFIQSVRNKVYEESKINDCMMCGRCTQYCPVGIDINALRLAKRNETPAFPSNFNNIRTGKVYKADVIYFAGCMTHLTPSIKKSMIKIFEYSAENYWFMDKDGSICCGRPQMLAGQTDAARRLIEMNKNIIHRSGAKILVTSCPICYKVFKNDYNLKIKVMHHTEYLWMQLISGRLKLSRTDQRVVYHDPCELGRGSNIYSIPRNLIKSVAQLQSVKEEKQHSLCCGGSLGNLSIQLNQRNAIRDHTLAVLQEKSPDAIITACPLCKKTFAQSASAKVQDISEFIAAALPLKIYYTKPAEMEPAKSEQKELLII